MEYGYVWEKFHLAALGLARSTETLRVRLGNAYLFHLSHLDRHELPETIREDFAALQEALSRKQSEGTKEA